MQQTVKAGSAAHVRKSRNNNNGTARTTPDRPEARIQARAYEIYLERTVRGAPGDALQDWLQAESEVRLGAGAAARV